MPLYWHCLVEYFTPWGYVFAHISWYNVGTVSGLIPANERQCYFVTRSLIGWAQALSIFHRICSCVSVYFVRLWLNSSPPGQNDRHFADNIFKCIFMNGKFIFWFDLHWSLFLSIQLTMSQHWFRYWLGAEQVTGRHLKQWPIKLMHICRARWKMS